MNMSSDEVVSNILRVLDIVKGSKNEIRLTKIITDITGSIEVTYQGGLLEVNVESISYHPPCPGDTPLITISITLEDCKKWGNIRGVKYTRKSIRPIEYTTVAMRPTPGSLFYNGELSFSFIYEYDKLRSTEYIFQRIPEKKKALKRATSFMRKVAEKILGVVSYDSNGR